MKTFVTLIGLLFGMNTYADYKAEALTNWLKTGTTLGVDKAGKKCEVILEYSTFFGGRASLELRPEGVELHKTPRFNSLLGSELLKIKESASSLLITIKSKPGDSYTSPLKQTVEIKKTAKGTEVSVVDKQTVIFGRTHQATCIID